MPVTMVETTHAQFAFGNATDVGRKRQRNEDYYANFETPNGYVFLVCDGMGGHAGGEKASRLAVDAIRRYLTSSRSGDPVRLLNEAFLHANREILDYAREHPELKGMGSTCVALLIEDGLYYYAHVGDSRIYHLSGSSLARLTRDHSFVQSLVDIGELSESEAEHHPRKNEITNALGLERMAPPSVSTVPVRPRTGDSFLLCTDGLTGMVDDRMIQRVLLENIPLQQKAHDLVQLANDAGGPDNITLQIVEVQDGFDGEKSIKRSGDRITVSKRQLPILAVLILLLGIGIGYGVSSFGIMEFFRLKGKDDVVAQKDMTKPKENVGDNAGVTDQGQSKPQNNEESATVGDSTAVASQDGANEKDSLKSGHGEEQKDIPSNYEAWKTGANNQDIEKINKWRKSIENANDQKFDDSKQQENLGMLKKLYEEDDLSINPELLVGNWECSMAMRLSEKEIAPLEKSTEWIIKKEAGGLLFEKTGGSEQKKGYLFQKSKNEFVFLEGKSQKKKPANHYSSFSKQKDAQNVVGILVKKAENRVVIFFLGNDSEYEVYELKKEVI